jgi:hypothetical protein
MSKSNLSTSQRYSTRNTHWVVRNDCDEIIKMGFESYEDKQRKLKSIGL